MVWTQALLWLIAGIILGAFGLYRLKAIGERHSRVVSLKIVNDPEHPHIVFKAVGVLERSPPATQGETIELADNKAPSGFAEQTIMFPITSGLRDGLVGCFDLRRPGRHPGYNYLQPFIVEHEGHSFVDLEMSISGYTLNMLADTMSLDELIRELTEAKAQLLAAPGVAIVVPLANTASAMAARIINIVETPATEGTTCDWVARDAFEAAMVTRKLGEGIDVKALPRCGKPAVVVVTTTCENMPEETHHFCADCRPQRAPETR